MTTQIGVADLHVGSLTTMASTKMTGSAGAAYTNALPVERQAAGASPSLLVTGSAPLISALM